MRHRVILQAEKDGDASPVRMRMDRVRWLFGAGTSVRWPLDLNGDLVIGRSTGD